MKNLVKDAWNNEARVELWEDGRFSRRCADLDRADADAYELLADCRWKSVSLLLRWRLPVTVGSFAIYFASFKNEVYQPARDATALEYWDGVRWKRIRAAPAVDASDDAQEAFYRRLGVVKWRYDFPPVSTHQLRFHVNERAAAGPRRICIVRDLECHERAALVPKRGRAVSKPRFAGRNLRRILSEAEIERIDRSGTDRLGKRLLAAGREASYESAAALLYPMDFCKSAIGRTNEGNETLVTWNGTLIMVEGVEDAAWDHYSEKSMAAAWKDQLVLIMEGMDKCVDRWFAFAVGKGGELVGTDLNRTRQEWIDGFKPGIRTEYRHGQLTYTFTAFVAAERSVPYLNVVEVEVENRSGREASAAVAVIMGRHASEAMHETKNPALGARFDSSLNPLFFAPRPTGYAMDAAGRLVRDQAGDIILRSSLPGRFAGSERERVYSVPLKIPPGGKQKLHFAMPGVAAPVRHAAALKAAEERLPVFREHWARTLTGKALVETPENRVNDFSKNAIAQILITLLNKGKLKYGSYWYEEYYGPEEGEALIALAKFGYAREVKAALEIVLSPALLDPNGYHHQYRHGVAAQAVAEMYWLDGDAAWLSRVAPRLAAVGNWIVEAINSETGRFAGLLPKRTYGGDISTPARNLSTNARCWRGLRDAGLLMRELGRDSLASRYLEEAAQYRRRIIHVIHELADRNGRHPFVPMGLDIGQKGGEDYHEAEKTYRSLSQEKMGAYWHIFAAWMLRSGILDADSIESRWITDYIEKEGGLLMGLLRLGKHYTATSVDIDPHYGVGYIQTLLARGEREKFLVSFYGMLAHAMSRRTFTSPESSCIFPLRSDPGAWNRMFHDTMWNWGAGSNCGLTEPLSSGAAAILLSLLRDMLVREDSEGKKTILHLLSGTPGAWLAPGREIAVQRAPTRHGTIELRAAALEDGSIRVRIAPRWRTKPDELRVHLHRPSQGKIASVRLNGKPCSGFGQNDVRLRAVDSVIQLDVHFK